MKQLLYGTIGLAMILFVVVVITNGRQDSHTDLSTTVPHFQTAIERRVTIMDTAQVSRNQDPVYVQLVSGAIPPEVTRLTVLSDENCAPDPDGVSHCLNRVTFQTPHGTEEAVLQHHHRMTEESCLAPGETLEIVS